MCKRLIKDVYSLTKFCMKHTPKTIHQSSCELDIIITFCYLYNVSGVVALSILKYIQYFCQKNK